MAINPDNILLEEEFKYLLEHECKRAQRYQYFFSLLIIRIESNNSQSPDLMEIPKIIKNLIRDSDSIGTIQYNKFAMLLCFADTAQSITNRIIGKIQSEIPLIKLKVGEACFPVSATTAEDLFRECQERIF